MRRLRTDRAAPFALGLAPCAAAAAWWFARVRLGVGAGSGEFGSLVVAATLAATAVLLLAQGSWKTRAALAAGTFALTVALVLWVLFALLILWILLP